MLNPNQLHCCHYCFHIDFLASLNWLRGSFLDIESMMQEKRKNFTFPMRGITLIWPLSKTECFCQCCNYANMCDSCWSINYLGHFQFICSESVDWVTPLCFSKSGYKGWSTILICIQKIKKWLTPYKEKHIYTVKTKTRKSCPRSISSEYTIDSILLFTVDEFREEEKSETFQLASYEYF